MKDSKLILSLLLLCINGFPYIQAQGFFPLHINNRWEYWRTPPPPNDYAWTTRAIRDTVMQNGFVFTQLQSNESFSYAGFFRQQDSRVLEFDGLQQMEHCVYDFAKTTGDTVGLWYSNGDTVLTTVLYDRLQNVFGQVRRQWGFYQRVLPSTFFVLREVTDSIGLTYMLVEAGESWYLRGAMLNGIQFGEITSISDNMNLPESHDLRQNFPNPFNPVTTIRFAVPVRTYVLLEIWDLLGRRVETVIDETMNAGWHSVLWRPQNLASGEYFYRLVLGEKHTTKKMIYIR